MKFCRVYVLCVLACLVCSGVGAQAIFKTIVPQRPIPAGESFQVQYIIEASETSSGFQPPEFEGLRMVSGPNTYLAKKEGRLRNMVFTLVASHAGNYRIPGASCLIDGKQKKSNDVFVKIIPAATPDDSFYYLKTGEDPIRKIRENLFLKLTLDKQSCFIGEPVVATFKLYSRVQSKSNVVKNPGFYGFSVYDMINLEDRSQSKEKLNGQWFDVHTIRKVQLYPLQAGIFTIDPMELSNEVEFSRDLENKEATQEITENMYGKKNATGHKPEIFELNISTNPSVINVKPLPQKNVADTFTGAVGNFTMNISLEKDSVMANDEDTLLVDISGAGNFQRVTSPEIKWPEGVDVFEPIVHDTLDKKQVPLRGRRTFKYVFVSGHAGNYTLPAIAFSYFDVTTKSYRTIASRPLRVSVLERMDVKNVVIAPIQATARKNNYGWLIALGAAMLFISLLFVYRQRQLAKRRKSELEKLAQVPPLITIDEILSLAKNAIDANGKTFYSELKLAIRNYFETRFGEPGTELHIFQLANAHTKGISAEAAGQLVQIIHQCETGIYANADMTGDQRKSFEKTEEILRNIESSIG